jgi:tubulin epsilon
VHRRAARNQVGQCGNQVGCRFWELALREHAAHNKGGRYDDALSSFFANVDTRTEPPTPLPLGDGRGAIRTLRVRCVHVRLRAGRACVGAGARCAANAER